MRRGMVKLWSVSNTVAPSDGIKRTPTVVWPEVGAETDVIGTWRIV